VDKEVILRRRSRPRNFDEIFAFPGDLGKIGIGRIFREDIVFVVILTVVHLSADPVVKLARVGFPGFDKKFLAQFDFVQAFLGNIGVPVGNGAHEFWRGLGALGGFRIIRSMPESTLVPLQASILCVKHTLNGFVG